MNTSPFIAARTALAMAAAACLAGLPLPASALGLGRLNVQSALGEGMRAEIDVTSLTPEEAATLQVRVASPDAYRAAGVDYNAVLSGARVSVDRRADGRATLRVLSDRAVQEPFVEVILELSWSTGRLVREFTLLFDPPGSRAAPPVQAAAPAAPLISAAPPAVAAAPGPLPVPSSRPAARPVPAPQPAPTPAPAPVAKAPAPMPMPTAPAPRPTAPTAAATGEQVKVRPGDSLSRIAARTAPQGVALDQMLVGLFRGNPDAFYANNINRLRAGAVLKLPAADEARGVSAAEAKQIIIAHSVDFGSYRSKLAQSAPQVPAAEASRQSQGKVAAAVDDRKAAAPSPDKLKLSSAAPPVAPVAAASAAEPPAPPKDSAVRVAELNRNLEELKKLQQGTSAAASAPAAAAPAANPTAAAASAVAQVGLAGVASAASAPLAVAGGMPASAPAARTPAPAPVTNEPGWMERLTDNPLLLPGAGLLAVLLAGLAAWKLRGRFAKPASETSFLESRMQPDSFFGASGGQRVDTRDASAPSSNSSMGYSLSQLDAIGDVDPVAEADVYLAYGRDLQAEEILKEAMRATPDRLAVRTKLLEVYAKRRDTKGFELLATQLFALTKGQGEDWAKAQELGRGIDPENQLYQPGGHPEEVILDGERVFVEPLGASTLPASVLSPPTQPFERPTQVMVDSRLDLDLDLDLGALEATQPAALMDLPPAPAPVPMARPSLDAGLDFDFADPPPAAPLSKRPPASDSSVERTVPGRLQAPDSLMMDLDDPRFNAPPVPEGDTLVDFGEFALSQPATLSNSEITTSPGILPSSAAAEEVDPMARKLELAEEFRQIGDMEGARDLLEEVIAKASGTLKAKAQAMLDALG